MNSEPKILYINRAINDKQQDFEFLFTIYRICINTYNSHVIFDFTGCSFLKQNAIAFIGALIRLLQVHENLVSFRLQSIRYDVKRHLEQNGFLHTFFATDAKWNGNSIPYREDMMSDTDNYTLYLSEKWLKYGWIKVSDRLKAHIISPVIEAYINVFDHASSPVGVVTYGQYYHKMKLLKITLVDFGVGIPYNVRTYLEKPRMSAKNALEWAFQPSSTTKDQTQFARGVGLKLLKEFIQKNRGKLEVYSDDGYMCVDATHSGAMQHTMGFKGTLVQITLTCDETHYILTDEETNDDWFF